ncbi:hypothetical protein PALB_13090 [Pseudoalteromonas luteoviolacea B = ATCC 29581]|nr:hypothetical protein PALB_13090 [Pseudoalteromonas luteoviolacea B = ATCC 29581]
MKANKLLKRLSAILFSLCLLIALTLFASVVIFPIPDSPFHTPTADSGSSDFHVVEFNDEGNAHDPRQQLYLLARLAKYDSKEVVLFVHGWHQNASPSDSNYRAFQRFHKQLNHMTHDRNVIGVYIGWRGDEYDPFWLDGSHLDDSHVEALDFPSIFKRKAISRKVGEQGLSKLLETLEHAAAIGQIKRYTLIGHSLGGSVALHASKERVKQNTFNQHENPNLVVLLNPAVTANEYKPLDKLVAKNPNQPQMIVLQSKGDFAVKEAFNHIKGQRAVGNSWAITHDIDQCPHFNCDRPFKIPESLKRHDETPGCAMTLHDVGWKIRARLNARKQVQSCEDANTQAVWVLAVSNDIVSGHNGILTSTQGKALVGLWRIADERHHLAQFMKQKSTEIGEHSL